MPIIELRKSNINLWEEFPDLDIITEFKKLREKEGDERSNAILKGIYYIWDPKSDKRDSGFTEEELIKDINKNLIGDKNFNWSEYEDVKQAWFKYCFTKTDSLLKSLEDEIEKLNEMIKNWTWTKKDASDKAATMKVYTSLYEDYKEIKMKFINEKHERDEMLGGYQITILEEYAENA